MRSTRDRQQVTEMLEEKRPLEDILSFFAAYWLYHYQGVRLLSFSDAQELTIERKGEMNREERRHLELEIRELLGDKHREEIDISRLASEFTVSLCKEVKDAKPSDPEALAKTVALLKDFLGQIPTDYKPNHDIDFINTVTGWSAEWRDELYIKASGLKETSLSLRDELLRDHPSETVEISILKRCIRRILGIDVYVQNRIIEAELDDATWNDIASSVLNKILGGSLSIEVIQKAHELRLGVIDALVLEFDSPTTITEYERVMGVETSKQVGELIQSEPRQAFEILSVFLDIDAGDIRAALRSKGLTETSVIAEGLILQTTEPKLTDDDGPQISPEELAQLERSLKLLEKLESTLEKSVKGALRAQGLRPTELDKITIEFLVKKRESLLGIEVKVLEALKAKTRVPAPEAMKILLAAREQVESGALSSIGMKSATDMVQRRQHDETLATLKLDLVWHFTIGLLTNLTRVVETYIRSKQDLLRTKALLKSIYEDTEEKLQFLREEILIDLAAMRIYELKVVLPELDASTICSWVHARLSNLGMSAAQDELSKTSSPVFEGIADTPLKLDNLGFDNYAIAYDVMHRFLKRERLEKLAKEEYALEAEKKRQSAIDKRRGKIDVIAWLDTKCKTVFRAISRVGTKGLEWSASDQSKCANLLAYYVTQHRGRPLCTVCGSAPADGKCQRHGKGNMTTSSDLDNLTAFVMESITTMKSSLVGATAEPMTWPEARRVVDQVITRLKRGGKITSKTNLKALMPGDLNYVIGPAIAKVIGKYFDESVGYVARRADIA